MTAHAVAHDVHAEEVVVVHRVLVLRTLGSHIRAAYRAHEESLDGDGPGLGHGHLGSFAREPSMMESTQVSTDSFLMTP
jgi:hypothetical protein